MLFCGGHDGAIKALSIKTQELLHLVFPKPPALIHYEFTPDVIGLAFNSDNTLGIQYSDMSLYQLKLSEGQKLLQDSMKLLSHGIVGTLIDLQVSDDKIFTCTSERSIMKWHSGKP